MEIRQVVLEKLKGQIMMRQHIVGVTVGDGLSAKCAAKGGADLILALNSARFRQMGLSSLAGWMPYSNANKIVMDYSLQEILPASKNVPVVFGFCASDPSIQRRDFLKRIKDTRFAGINNYPPVGMIDGCYRMALERADLGFHHEVEAIAEANDLGLLSIASVFTPEQAELMLDAGADIICAHLGLTKGGMTGAKKVLSLESGSRLAQEIFQVCEQRKAATIKLVSGGPVSTPVDVEYIYENTSTNGFLGGSIFDRIPSEDAIRNITSVIKAVGGPEQDVLYEKMLSGITKHYDYVSFVKEYISANYAGELSLANLAGVAHVSTSYLSTLFRQQVGCSFSDYVTNFRIGKARRLIQQNRMSLSEVAELCGYSDYSHFSRIFKKHTGSSPRAFQKSNQKTSI